MAQDGKENKVSYKDTLNLPHTDFPLRSHAAEDDPKMVARWEAEGLYEQAFIKHSGAKKFILHDGPPYANGHIHLGHAYNKILKDIITKYHRMKGEHVPVTPGWDCHGLPIELGVSRENPGLSPEELKAACRVWAQKWIDIQRQEFKRLGVVMNWDHPYKTMDPSYESATLKALAILFMKGFVKRKNKTVAWCASCQTVLASAEIEHKDRKDPSIYVLFPLDNQTKQKLVADSAIPEVSVLIWTTTPWTLPLNRAVLFHPQGMYHLRKCNDTYFITGAVGAEKIDALLGQPTELIAEIPGSRFEGLRAQHPFIENLSVPFIGDTSVGLDEGTAFVHCAPGVGPEDYEIGVKNNLEIFAPISSDGRYQKGIIPVELEGSSVADGQGWVIAKLLDVNRLFMKKSIHHAYPHCWRCRNGLIFRATRQWFIDLSKDNLQQKALQCIQDLIQFIPEQGRNFLYATVENRWEWCVSRQRVWGVPIPAVICTACDTEFTSKELIDRVAEGVEKHGVEYWDTVDLDHVMPQGHRCAACHGRAFKKEFDILDVWFDSGVSHYAVLFDKKENNFPADVYLEGIDQHRGWFQSSLLTSLALEDAPAMKSIMTHGFTVDAKGQKMSKSIGNVVAPEEIIKKLGIDGLRLWVSSLDCEGDATVSDVLLNNVTEVLRKIRNTFRFLLSNLNDFDKDTDALALGDLLPLDQYALERLYEVQQNVLGAYEKGKFTAIFHEMGQYCSAELSAFYLDIIKDRLYVEKADGLKRRSCQTVSWYILDTLIRLLAPILSFTSEQVSDYFYKNKSRSIHLERFNPLHEIKEWLEMTAPETAIQRGQEAARIIRKIQVSGTYGSRSALWNDLQNIRHVVLKAIEELRQQGVVKHSLEARVTLHLDLELPAWKEVKNLFASMLDRGLDIPEFLKEFFIVSQVVLAEQNEGLDAAPTTAMALKVERAYGVKCPRCWNWDETDHENGLCRRCQEVLA